MKKKKRRIGKGQVFLNLLPWITALGIGGVALCKTYGPDINEAYNNWKIQNKYLNGSYSFELPEMPSWDDVKKFLGIEEETVEVEAQLPTTPIEIEPIQEEPEEVVEEEVEPEPVIYPEYTSSELLDSGYEFLDIDFDSLKDENGDVVGWIEVPGTSISYPVVQGQDNEYYLHHDLDGNESVYGTVYVDSRVDLSLGDDSSTIQNTPIGIFGHHMSVTRPIHMFRPLMNYKQSGYVDKYPYAVYYSPEGVYKLSFFADQYSSGNSDETVYTNQLGDETQFNEWTTGLISNSKLTTDVVPEYGDKIGYLITCSYEQDNYRYALWYVAEKQYTNEIDRENSVEDVKSLTLN